MDRLIIALLVWISVAGSAWAQDEPWQTLTVPGAWEQAADGRLETLDGFAWYRCFVQVPAAWKGQRLMLTIGRVDDVDEAFFNGRPVGANGSPPPLYQAPNSAVRRPFVIDPDLVRFGEWNLIAWRVYDAGGRGGLVDGPVQLMAADQAIDLSGAWQFRPGDRASWAYWPAQPGTPEAGDAVAQYLAAVGEQGAGHRGLVSIDEATRRATVEAALERFSRNKHTNARIDDKGAPRPPREALAALRPAEDLAIDLIAHEPAVTQPIHVAFDERGRMWVTQYLQYPTPAGVQVVSYDEHLRAVYDKIPPPPPHHLREFRGRDRITIHEDTEGDGTFDSVRTFLDGLNITTSTARGRGGVWVMNPPYLLFYPDRDSDDVPDSDPVVHLSGFGLEDTHSVANSLTWGPDGWLYGGVGSTVTARVRVHLNEAHPVIAFLGQAIWRYHPVRHVFEIFSEGGYNTFGVDFDDVGRVYSGTNSGPRGVHFVQEGYYRKAFGKHGPLSNPFALGYLDAMPHTGDSTRLTHQFIIEGGGTLPDRYRGTILAVNSLANWVVATRLEPSGSTFRTVDDRKVIETDDKWFRPVHIETGPDGFAYISDWYDARITHLDPTDNWDRERGRIYRLRSRDARPGYRPFNLADRSSAELVGLLSHENRWFRATALRLLGDRQDATIIPRLLKIVEKETGQLALEATWALYQLGALDEPLAMTLLDHPNQFVRMWTVRLLADDRQALSPSLADRLAQLACQEPSVHVRSQLAASAKRLRGEDGLRIVHGLVSRAEDADDPHLPLQLWWAVEDKAISQRREVGLLLTGPDAWEHRLVSRTILPRLAQRYAADPTEDNRRSLLALIASAPAKPQREALIAAALDATRGRGVDLSFLGGDATTLRLTMMLNLPAETDAIAAALEMFASTAASMPAARQVQVVQVLAESRDARVPAALLKLAGSDAEPYVRIAALAALGAFDDPGLAAQIIEIYPGLGDRGLRHAAIGVLASRPAWSMALLGAVQAGTIRREDVPAERLDVLRGSSDPAVLSRLEEVFGKPARATTAEKQQEIERLAAVITSGTGDAAVGKPLFAALCARCHILHGHGLDIGPDLSIAKRDDVRELLLSIVDPSAGIHEDYTAYSFTLADGRQLIGFITDRQAGTLKLRDLSGAETAVAAADIRSEQALPASIMPEGLLSALTDQQIRDLTAYVMSKSEPAPK